MAIATGTRAATGSAAEADSKACGQKAARAAWEKIGKERVDLAIVFAATKYKYAEVLAGIKAELGEVPLIGCSTAGEFCDGLVSDKAVVIMLLHGDSVRFSVGHGKGLRANSLEAVRGMFSQFAPAAAGGSLPHRSLLMLSDGLAGNGEQLVINAALKLGKDASLVGGAAGDGGAFKETFVFHNGQVYHDAVVGVEMFSARAPGVGVSHGWCPSKCEGVVTKTTGGIINEIDNKPAFRLYEEYAKAIGYLLTPANSDMFMMTHEIGMQVGAGEIKVRAPIKRNPDGSILMATEVPKGMKVSIVEGECQALLAAAKSATEKAIAGLKGAKPAALVVFDCIARKICLKDDFLKEVEIIRKAAGANVPVIGFNTYGEIARVPGQLSGFHNTTDVVFAIPA